MSVNWTIELAHDNSPLRGQVTRDFNYCHNVFVLFCDSHMEEKAVYESAQLFNDKINSKIQTRDS